MKVLRASLTIAMLLSCTYILSLVYTGGRQPTLEASKEQEEKLKCLQGSFQHCVMHVEKLWTGALSYGWRPSASPRFTWTNPPNISNGYLLVRCNGGLNQQRTAICNAVLAARIMSATLVLPELDTNSFWHDKSGFSGIYDVDHFICSLKHDVKIVKSMPSVHLSGEKRKKLKAFQIRPPRDAQPSWYETFALEKMKEHGAIYLTPFSHRLAEELTDHEYQRLRCRVNFHALRFREEVMHLSDIIVQRLRSEGRFMAIHLRFEMDMLAFAGCLAIFTPEEQNLLRAYREQNFAHKRLIHDERMLIGKCPLTPEEVGLILRSMGFSNSTRIYIAAGNIFGGERYLSPLQSLFPRLESRSTIATVDELVGVNAYSQGLFGPAVDYMVCLKADIFMPTYDGPSNFANNLLGHRLYEGFKTSIQPNRKVLAPIFMDREKGLTHNFDQRIGLVMQNVCVGDAHPRVPPESFYANPWSECFCKSGSKNLANTCPSSPFS